MMRPASASASTGPRARASVVNGADPERREIPNATAPPAPSNVRFAMHQPRPAAAGTAARAADPSDARRRGGRWSQVQSAVNPYMRQNTPPRNGLNAIAQPSAAPAITAAAPDTAPVVAT